MDIRFSLVEMPGTEYLMAGQRAAAGPGRRDHAADPLAPCERWPICEAGERAGYPWAHTAPAAPATQAARPLGGLLARARHLVRTAGDAR